MFRIVWYNLRLPFDSLSKEGNDDKEQDEIHSRHQYWTNCEVLY